VPASKVLIHDVSEENCARRGVAIKNYRPRPSIGLLKRGRSNPEEPWNGFFPSAASKTTTRLGRFPATVRFRGLEAVAKSKTPKIRAVPETRNSSLVSPHFFYPPALLPLIHQDGARHQPAPPALTSGMSFMNPGAAPR